MSKRADLWFGLVAGLVLAAGGLASAADPQKGAAAEPSPEVRSQMAAVHEKMATCLKSSRPLAECREEMSRSCQSMMGEAGCPMMQMGHGGMGPGMGMGPGRGMHHGQMMQGASPEKAPEKTPAK